MDESYIDLAKMLWNEMNPIEGWTSPQANFMMNSRSGEPPRAALFKHNINNITNIDGSKVRLPFLTKANIPGYYADALLQYGDKPYHQAYVVPEDEIRYVRNDFDKIKNRIPTKSMGKIVNKILSEPAVRIGGKVLGKVLEPLAILDGLGLNSPAY